MKKSILFKIVLILMLIMPITSKWASAEEAKTLSDLPFQGYFIGPEDSGIEGLLIEDNQLYIYIKDHSKFYEAEGCHHHGAEGDYEEEETDHEGEEMHHHEVEAEDYFDQEFIQWLFEFASFPYPDLKAYSPSVRKVYLEELQMPTDMQVAYMDIAEEITPEMSQLDILNLINNRIPGVYYTEKFGYQYFTLASPTVTESKDYWKLSLLGNDIFSLKQEGRDIVDSKGTTYEYIDGIKPN